MANEITFKFKSDAPWSEAELDDLFHEFLAVVKPMDDDFVDDSATINLVDEGGAGDNSKEIRDAAIELIANGKLVVSIDFRDSDGNELYQNDFDADAV